jgi:hypothetical protein
MRYISTLNIWAAGIQQAIETGQIKLQRGQWLRCGSTGKRCRFVGVSSSGSIWVTHWQGSSRATAAKFNAATVAFTRKGLL